MHGLSLTATVMTMECRIVIVLLSLLKTVDVDLKCIVVGDETEKKKITVINNRQSACEINDSGLVMVMRFGKNSQVVTLSFFVTVYYSILLIY